MNCCCETVKMGVPPGNRRCWTRGVPERYVAGCDTRGRPEGRPYPRSQQVIHEISGLAPSPGKNTWVRAFYRILVSWPWGMVKPPVSILASSGLSLAFLSQQFPGAHTAQDKGVNVPPSQPRYQKKSYRSGRFPPCHALP